MTRVGSIARKLGMTQRFQADGSRVPVTVLSLEGCQVVATRTVPNRTDIGVQLGLGAVKASRVNKAAKGYFAKQGVEPKQHLKEFRVEVKDAPEVGSIIKADHFVVGQFIDVAGITIGRGFAGAMKRHNFGGLRATHGVSVSHRSHGSTGGRQDPGKVFKGKKMAGHMGQVQVTAQNLVVVATDVERGLVFVHGNVPGCENSIVFIKDSVKKKQKVALPTPGSFSVPGAEAQQPADVVGGGDAA
ncbi:MAG: 50S ribosomal protein L3 [Alphaproteobacteria bacterium]|jgi:large subunit ribosomal protein L3|nr:50S ribosomal protein L3 [Thalassospira sp.]MCE2965102.1 50S ribosomal protein L3 [Alphaproteobacteria bacterium]